MIYTIYKSLINHTQHLLFIIVLLCSICSYGQTQNDAPLSHKAPTDKPHNLIGADRIEEYNALIAPYVAKAQESLPKAKTKFLKGLKDGQAFFLTTRIYDQLGNSEQIFVRVITWDDNEISGTIANSITTVTGFSYGQFINFPESKILDWLITHPNGKEKGNYIGKFLDTQNR